MRFDGAVFGIAAFTLGLAAIEMQQPVLARAAPIGVGVVVVIAGALQLGGRAARTEWFHALAEIHPKRLKRV